MPQSQIHSLMRESEEGGKAAEGAGTALTMAGLAGQKLGHGPGFLTGSVPKMYGQTQADHVLPGLLQAKSGRASSWDESIESIVCPSTPVSPSKLGRWALQDKQYGLALGGWDPPSLYP
ncbi:hypothetical protein CPAR01_05796 [Colletotrichum paranaense]|uniref:Uncharacterized protein n=1 Tax=Colletotrichum paranaense TaxID=1914294 RepID=A0ABQ9ST60_9PEZI|nr:uncharacterized protein CPAR01_05796 [Colletotrichum paranaense]KAK1542409.1 hypothetical protein CPAR01_05796 [Colletotrichum paranaense]